MLKGLYAAASGMLSGLNRQTVLTHNITNLDTPGFKQVMLTMEDWVKTDVNQVTSPSSTYPFLPERYPTTALQRADLNSVGELGLGVYNPAEVYDFQQGALKTTNQPLDMAIQGDGFFRVRTPDGDRFTRDGRFYRDVNRNLVTVDGNFVLDQGGSPITLPDGEVTVKTDGTLAVDGTEIARLDLTMFEDPKTDLVRDMNMFEAVGTPQAATGRIYNKVLENSNVDLSQIMTQMIAIGRSYEASQRMVTVQDTLLGKSIGTLGRF